MMNKKNILISVSVIIIVFIFTVLARPQIAESPQGGGLIENGVLDRTITDGTIGFSLPSTDFGIATNEQQVLVHSYIPPCDFEFDYCLYYVGNKYKGTNFESAGLRIKKRSDLSTEQSCINTSPSGFDAKMKPDKTTLGQDFSTSAFLNVGDAAAGHYASGSSYRLYIKENHACYEFETRVGQTQFLNYPPGSIGEFTIENQKEIRLKLEGILKTVRLQRTNRVAF